MDQGKIEQVCRVGEVRLSFIVLQPDPTRGAVFYEHPCEIQAWVSDLPMFRKIDLRAFQMPEYTNIHAIVPQEVGPTHPSMPLVSFGP